MTTGWIEAPATGNYVFEASQQPSRLLINGTKILDWFEFGGHDQRLDHAVRRTEVSPALGPPAGRAPSGPGQGVTWQVPGTVGQTPIPTANLYALAPVSPTGMTVTYFTTSGFGGATVTRTDANIDINKNVAPPGATPLDLPSGYGPSYSARWEGEIVPSFTEDHTFYVVGSGSAALTINGNPVSFLPPPPSVAPGPAAPMTACEFGPKLDASCDNCVPRSAPTIRTAATAAISRITRSSRCGMRSALPTSRRIVRGRGAPRRCRRSRAPPSRKAAARSTMQAGVHYRIQLSAVQGPATDKTIRLLWSSPRQAKQAIPEYAFRPLTAVAAAVGSGLNVTYFATVRWVTRSSRT